MLFKCIIVKYKLTVFRQNEERINFPFLHSYGRFKMRLPLK
jgi:hypothetical protein